MRFEWDEEKRKTTLRKHGIDFLWLPEVFAQETLILPSNQKGEERWLAIGMLGTKEIAVIFTKRGETIRIITARRARENERRAYHARHS